MKPLIPLVLLVLSISFPLYSQDTVVYLNDLTFYSDIEKEVVTHNFNLQEKDYVSLFLISNKNITRDGIDRIKKRIDNGYKTLLSKNVESLPEKKKIKTIFKTVHELFLHKYDEYAEFNQIFDDGTYNCVTAVALFSMYFDMLNIPYVINQTPVHVYILTYPTTHRILIETTNPLNGYLSYKPIAKKAFVENLYRNKLISSEEFQSQSINELFDEYFFTDDSIGLDQLVGIHFYNKAFKILENKNYKESFIWAEKGALFYPMEQTLAVMLSSSAEILDHSDYDFKDDVKLLAKVSRFKSLGITKNDIVNEYLKLIRTQLIDKGNVYHFKDVSQYLVNNLKDSATRSEVAFHFYYEYSRYHYNKGQYNEAVEYGEKAVQISPNNSDAQSILVYGVIQSLQKEIYQDSVSIKVDSYFKKYPFLKNNDLLNGYKLQSYLLQAIDYFETNNSVLGDKNITLFEQQYLERYLSNLDKNIIVRSYLSGAMYYFRKYNNTKAKQLLNKGLEFAPNNFDLKRRLEQISDY